VSTFAFGFALGRRGSRVVDLRVLGRGHQLQVIYVDAPGIVTGVVKVVGAGQHPVPPGEKDPVDVVTGAVDLDDRSAASVVDPVPVVTPGGIGADAALEKLFAGHAILIQRWGGESRLIA
jgi:hypothetical protein